VNRISRSGLLLVLVLAATAVAGSGALARSSAPKTPKVKTVSLSCSATLTNQIDADGVPVVIADCSLQESLKSACVEHARCLIALTDDDVTGLSGKKDELIGKLQERYGYTREQAETEANEFARANSGVSDAEVQNAAARANTGRV